MTRRVVFILLALVVPAATIAVAGLPLASRSRWAKRRLHEAVAIQLAQTLDAEVRVGEVAGDLIHGFRISDVAVSEGRSFAEGTLASAKKVEVKCNTWAALRRRTPAIEAVEVIRLVGLRGHLKRGPDGKLNIDRFLPKPKPFAPLQPRFMGRIVVEDAELLYTDRAPWPRGMAGLEVRLAHLDGIADFARRNAVELSVRADGAQAPFTRVEATGSYTYVNRALSLNGGLTNLDGRAVYNRFSRSQALRVRSGIVDVTGNLCVVPGKLIDYVFRGRARQVAADVPALRGGTVQAEGEFALTPAGVALRHVRGHALGAEITADGAIIGLTAPSLDVAGSAKDVDFDRWAKLVPRLAASLPKVSGAHGIRVQGRVSGSLNDPDISLAADFPSAVGVRYAQQPAEAQQTEAEPPEPAVLEARAPRLGLSISVPALKSDDAVVRVSAPEVQVSDLGAFLPKQRYLHEVKLSPVRNLTAEIVYSRDTPVTAGRLVIDRIETDRGPIGGVSIRYALLDRAVRAEVSANDVLGGRATANGLVDFSRDSPEGYAQFGADGVDLSELASAVSSGEYDVQGKASATGVVALAEGKVEAAAEVGGERLRLGSVELDIVRAHLGVNDEATDVRYLTAAGPLGALWARGTVPFEGPAELEVTAANVPLAQVETVLRQSAAEEPAEASDEPPAPPPPPHATGFGFAHGWVRGERREPQVEADVAVFGGGVGKVTTEALTATVGASPAEVTASDLLVRRGSAVAQGALALRDITWPPGSYFADEPTPAEPDAEPVESHLDGTLDGFVQVWGAELAQMKEFARLPPHLRLAGVMSADASISGTLRQPTAEGRVFGEHLKAADEARDVAVGPAELVATFAASRDEVELLHGSMTSDAGSMTVSGKVGGWGTEEGPFIKASFDGRDLPVASYMPSEGPAVLLGGTVDKLVGTVEGPLSDPGPDVKAHLSADELRFGRRGVADLEGDLRYLTGVLSAGNVTCRVADGALRIRSASYRPSDRKMSGDIAVGHLAGRGAGDLDARELLFLAGDVASRGRDDPESVALRDRVYGIGHRVRGKLAAGKVTFGGTPGNLEGYVRELSVKGTELDRREIPGLVAGFHFAGLALDAIGQEPSSTSGESGVHPALAHLRVDDLRVTSDPIGEGVILVHGADVAKPATVHWDGLVDVIVEADLVPVSAVNDWLPPGLDVGGKLAFMVRAQRPAADPKADPRIAASFEVLEPTIAGVEFDLLQAAHVDVQPEAIVMTGGLLKRGANEVQAEGSLPIYRDRLKLDPDGPVSFEARIDELPPEVLLQLADEFAGPGPEGEPSVWSRCEAEGLLTAWLNVEGKLAQPEVTGGISLEPSDKPATFRMVGWPASSTITDIDGDVLLGPSPTGVGAMVEMLDVRGRWQTTQLGLEGHAEVSHLNPDEWLQNQIEELTFTASTAETGEQRFPGGTVAKDLKLVLRAHTDADGWHRVTVEEGSARLGAGTATLTGNVLLDTLHLSELGNVPCDLRLVLDKAGMKYGRALGYAQVDGAIVARKFASATGRALPEWFLAGKTPRDRVDPSAPALITTAPKAPPYTRGALEVTGATLGLPEAGKLGAGPGEAPPLQGWASHLPSPEFDATVATGQHVRFKTAIANWNIVPDPQAVRLTGTPQEPVLHASATVRNGRLQLLGGVLAVPSAGASVDITPVLYGGSKAGARRDLQMVSQVWGHASGTVSGKTVEGNTVGPVRVEMDLSGSAPDYVLETSSSPSLTPEEVKKLLVIGPVRPEEERPADQSETLDEMIARTVASRMFRGVLEPIEEELTESLGLEQFVITVGVNQPVEFRVGKYLVENLLVSYRRTAGGPEPESDLRVSYRLRGKYQLSWHTGDRQRSEFGVEYRWHF